MVPRCWKSCHLGQTDAGGIPHLELTEEETITQEIDVYSVLSVIRCLAYQSFLSQQLQ